ncbi:MAG: ATP-binding protein, partial [Bacteroidota bacterium]
EIIEFDGQRLISKKTAVFDKAKHPSDQALFFYEIYPEEETFWGLSNEGIVNFNSFSDYHIFPSPIKSADIASILPFQDSLFWVATHHPTRLFLFNKNSSTYLPTGFKPFNIDKNVAIKKVTKILAFKDSILWLGEEGVGIYYTNVMNKRILSLFNQYDIEASTVYQITDAYDGNISCMTANGSNLSFTEDKDISYTATTDVFKCLADREGNTWGIGGEGLFYKKRGEPIFELIYQPVNPDDIFFDLIDWNPEQLILSTDKGIFFFDKVSFQLEKMPIEKWGVFLFKDSDNNLWIANADGTLSLWEVKNIKEKHQIKSIKNYEYLGLIHHIVEDQERNSIWVSTSEGLHAIDIYTFAKKQYTESDGLPNQFIYAVALDEERNLWLSSNKGIIRFAPSAKTTERFRHFTTRDGLSADEYYPGAVYTATNGEIWFGSTKGVDVFHPKKMSRIGKAPQFAIQQLKIHDQEWKGDFDINATKHIKLKHYENTLTFDLAAMEYTDPLRNQFKVYLKYKGQADTSLLGIKNSITYANLSPGEYTFEFTVGNSEGIWQQALHQLSVYIIPPIHQRTWFQVLVIVLVLCLVSFFSAFYYRYRLRESELKLAKKEKDNLILEQKLFLEKERVRTAEDMHDQMGSGLSTIRNISIRNARKTTDETIKNEFERISTISILLKKNMRELIWALDAENDSLPTLIAWTRAYMKEFLDDNALISHITMPKHPPNIALTGRYRYNLVLVIKEALHNIVKSAKASTVNFDMQLEDHQLKISIKDDGVGFEHTQSKELGGGVGLRSMKKRIASLGGEIKWESVLDKGTDVIIFVPLPLKVL